MSFLSRFYFGEWPIPDGSNAAIHSHDRTLVFKWLHTLSLGLSQAFIKRSIHDSFKSDAWETHAAAMEQRISISIDRIRYELSMHYKEEREAGIDITEVSDLTASTFGTVTKPVCHLKGAETNHFLNYFQKVLERKEHQLPGGSLLLQACKSLRRCIELIHLHPWRFPHDAIEEPPTSYTIRTKLAYAMRVMGSHVSNEGAFCFPCPVSCTPNGCTPSICD